jgi:hypothetical protein
MLLDVRMVSAKLRFNIPESEIAIAIAIGIAIETKLPIVHR